MSEWTYEPSITAFEYLEPGSFQQPIGFLAVHRPDPTLKPKKPKKAKKGKRGVR